MIKFFKKNNKKNIFKEDLTGMKEKVCQANLEAYSGGNASKYDKRYCTPCYNNFHSNNVKNVLKYFKDDNLKIIEIGCGTGLMTQHIFKYTKNSKIFCLDLSKEALNILKEKLSEEDVKRSKFICGDATEYFKNCRERFDMITVHGALHHIFDYLELVEFSSKCLKKNGIYYIASEDLPGKYYNSYLREFLRIFERVFYEKNKLLLLLYVPFNFLGPVINSKHIKPFKDKIFHGEIYPRGDLVDYWGYKKGVEPDNVRKILESNNIKIIEYNFITGFYYEIIHKIAKILNIKPYFTMKGVKKY